MGDNRKRELTHNLVLPTLLFAAVGGMVAVSAWILLRPRSVGPRDDPFPRAYCLLWIVLLVQNTLAQLITGLLTNWNEVVFSIYYVLLFIISAVIVCHYQFVKTKCFPQVPNHEEMTK